MATVPDDELRATAERAARALRFTRRWGGASAAALALLLMPSAEALADDYPTVRYNQVRMKNAHNAYDADENLPDLLQYHAIRSLELDIHFGDSGVSDAPPGDWRVYHAAGLDLQTSCYYLSDCFEQIRTFHLQNPSHEVITLLIDVKSGWGGPGSGKTQQDLDNLIDDYFSTGNLLSSSEVYTPHFMWSMCGPCNTLQTCVDGTFAGIQGCAWPLLSDLKGKIIFVLTSDDDVLDQYADTTSLSPSPAPWSRRAFTAREVSSLDESLNSCPPPCASSSSIRSHPHQVFYNMSAGNAAAVMPAIDGVVDADHFHPAFLVGRSFKSDTQSDWDSQVSARVNLIGTNEMSYLADPWSRTHTSTGFPFTCSLVGKACSDQGTDLGHSPFWIDVDSDDIYGTGDNMVFGYVQDTSASLTYQIGAFGPNSHVESWGKACLMVRRNLAPNAAYVGICRTADGQPLQLQYRASAGATAQAYAMDMHHPSLNDDGIPYMKLASVYHQDTNKTDVTIFGSWNNATWTLLASTATTPAIPHITGTLPYGGIGVSSHGSPSVRWRLHGLTGNGWPLGAGSLYYQAIGTVRSWGLGSGW